jgi:hypothetical protein
MATTHRSTYLSVQHFRASAYVRVIRNEAPFKSVVEVCTAIGACRPALKGVDAAHYGILFDWRLGPISTDPSLHKALVEQIDALAEPFARKAILLGTIVGAMQASRVGRALGNQEMVIFFDDEAAAVEHVTRS